MWHDKIQIQNTVYQKCGKPVSKPAKTNVVSGAQSGVIDTQIFFWNSLFCSCRSFKKSKF